METSTLSTPRTTARTFRDLLSPEQLEELERIRQVLPKLKDHAEPSAIVQQPA